MIPGIADPVASDLGGPDLPARRRQFEHGAVVAMPETAVHQKRGTVPWENDIGSPGKVLSMEAVPQTPGVEPSSEQQFGLGVLAADAAHVEPALFSGQDIGHGRLMPSRQRR